jgi:hypothetical protein
MMPGKTKIGVLLALIALIAAIVPVFAQYNPYANPYYNNYAYRGYEPYNAYGYVPPIAGYHPYASAAIGMGISAVVGLLARRHDHRYYE